MCKYKIETYTGIDTLIDQDVSLALLVSDWPRQSFLFSGCKGTSFLTD